MIDYFNDYEPYKMMVYTLSFIFGMFIGSFLNVVALRLLKETSIVFPGSHCPKCNHPIRFYDNIPVISYVILGGKCRDCKEPISVQYPLVEFSTGVLFLLCTVTFGLSLETIAMMYIIANLVVITVTDLYEQYIFNVNSIPLIPAGLIFNLFNLGHDSRPPFNVPIMPPDLSFNIPGVLEGGILHIPGLFVSGVFGVILAIAFFEGFSKLSEVFFGEGKYGFGGGDTRLCAGLGAWFGWEALLAIIFISFILQVIPGIPLIINQMVKAKDWLSIKALIVVGIGTLVPLLLNVYQPFSTTIAVGIILVCFVIIAVALIIILKQVKQRDALTYMPLGPAIVLATIIFIFHKAYILAWLGSIFTRIG